MTNENTPDMLSPQVQPLEPWSGEAYEQRKARLYVSDFSDKKWDRVFTINRILEDELGDTTVENGMILPLRVRDDLITHDEAYAGGVCGPDFSFVAGLRRDYVKENVNLSVCNGYEVDPASLIHYDETVVFGGILFDHFGHFLTLSTTRLWWHQEHPDQKYRYVFLYNDLLKIPSKDRYPKEFFDLIGLPEQQILIIDQPSSFNSVIVPDEACYILTRASRKWLLPFEAAKKSVNEMLPPSPYRKLYLSRSAYIKYGNGDGINESYYEDFFARRGYHILHPEQYSLAEQINYLMAADDIVCTFGTLSHMLLFAKDGVRHTSILRTRQLWIHQAVINAVRRPDWYWVEGTINPLPTPHDHGLFLYHPTSFFRAYLDHCGIPYEEEELLSPLPADEDILLYMRSWTRHFTEADYYWRIKDRPVFEYVNALSTALLGQSLNAEDFPKSKADTTITQLKDQLKKQKKEAEKEQARLEDIIKQQKKDLASCKQRITAMQDSLSWKATEPLRSMRKKMKRD